MFSFIRFGGTELTLQGQQVFFASLREFDMFLSGMTGLSMARFQKIVSMSADGLDMDFKRHKKLQARFSDILTQLPFNDGRSSSSMLEEIRTTVDLSQFSLDYQWRELFRAIYIGKAVSDTFVRLALSKYLEYINTRQGAILYFQEQIQSASRQPEPEPVPVPRMHDSSRSMAENAKKKDEAEAKVNHTMATVAQGESDDGDIGEGVVVDFPEDIDVDSESSSKSTVKEVKKVKEDRFGQTVYPSNFGVSSSLEDEEKKEDRDEDEEKKEDRDEDEPTDITERLEPLPKGKAVDVVYKPNKLFNIFLSKHPFGLLCGESGVILSDLKGRKYLLKTGFSSVGRDVSCDVIVDAHLRDISRRHLLLQVDENMNVKLTDLSSHGTYVSFDNLFLLE